jgi:hypothetical protein
VYAAREGCIAKGGKTTGATYDAISAVGDVRGYGEAKKKPAYERSSQYDAKHALKERSE